MVAMAKSTLFHVIKDPVHGSMQFDSEENKWIKPFIDSENFQRLRQIKQLGMADLIYPGAVHNRFSHGIGSCYIASQICNKLGSSVEDKQTAMLACLLHDIGHGPFSHAFENIFYRQYICHEMWTPLFLAEYNNPDFLSTFNANNKKHPLTAKKFKEIQELIMHQAHEKTLLADIVSSQLDADRLDYLLRDSHFCGVIYGEYDFRWLLHCLTAVKKDRKTRLGITHKGIGVIEEYLMARRLMMRNVYQHGKKNGAEYLLQLFLKYLAKGIAEDSRFRTLTDITLIQFLQEMNSFNKQVKKEKNSNNIKKLCGQFVRQNYHLYKQLCDYDVFILLRELSQWKNNHPAVAIAKRLQKRKLPKIIYINGHHIKTAKKLVREFKVSNLIQPWQLTILTLPHLSYEINRDSILVTDSIGNVKYLHDNSLMINALSDKRESFYLVCIDSEIAGKAKVKKLQASLQNL
jgi:uncharacterized protein